jgi:hypothetical protein
VNAEYSTALQQPLKETDLNANVPRVLQALEEVFKQKPLKLGVFGHFRPARYFSEHLSDLEQQISSATKMHFTSAFERLNALVK